MSSDRLQQVLDTCRRVFNAGFRRATIEQQKEALQPLVDVLNHLTLRDVGLDRSMGFKTVVRAQYPWLTSDPVMCQHIYQDQEFALDIFFLPEKDICIPLHDHPGMVVMSKVLFGDVEVQAYDWKEPLNDAFSPRKSGEVVTAHDTRWGERSDCSVLYPSEGGNLHAFHALSPCAFFDIISPPYSDKRVCTFYKEESNSIGGCQEFQFRDDAMCL